MSVERGLNGVTDACDDSGFYLGAAHAVLCCLSPALEASMNIEIVRTAIAAVEKLVWLAAREQDKEYEEQEKRQEALSERRS